MHFSLKYVIPDNFEHKIQFKTVLNEIKVGSGLPQIFGKISRFWSKSDQIKIFAGLTIRAGRFFD